MKEDEKWRNQIDYYGMIFSIHCVIFQKYMTTIKSGVRNKASDKIPRNYNPIFTQLFDACLNIPSSQETPDLQTEFIVKLENLFKDELDNSVSKSNKYLKDLKDIYNNLP